MDNTDYIDDYFKNLPTGEQKQQFEQRIINDSSFAEEVAFYISANGILQAALQDEKKQRFRELYNQQKVVPFAKKSPIKRLWPYLSAASVAAAIFLFTWFFAGNKDNPEQLASQYIQKNLTILPVEMGTGDSIQSAFELYNNHKYREALTEFESRLKKDSSNAEAKKFAGIASLKLLQFDKALTYFSSLASDTSLRSNFGKFYEALTLMERNKKGDKASLRKLLREIEEQNNTEGKSQAKEWRQKLDL